MIPNRLRRLGVGRHSALILCSIIFSWLSVDALYAQSTSDLLARAARAVLPGGRLVAQPAHRPDVDLQRVCILASSLVKYEGRLWVR
jgi:hypothetical protein